MSLDLSWPQGLFSLSHVSIPFPPDDPIYGGRADDGDDNAIVLGSVAIRGERNLLQIPDDFFLRLRYNPFFPYLSQRLTAFLQADNQYRKRELDSAVTSAVRFMTAFCRQQDH